MKLNDIKIKPKKGYGMINQEELKRNLSYDPNTGLFTRLIVHCNRVKVGSVAGTNTTRGYVDIRLYGKLYKAHRLAWLYITGKWPQAQIDHINGIKTDNRWENLREATPQENLRNLGIRSRNTSGFKGVSFCKRSNKWRASASVDNKYKHLGFYETAELASEAYERHAKAKFGEFYKAKFS
jgi:hypothetical protein